MGVSVLMDLTLPFNDNSKVNIDISTFDWGIVQIESGTGAINFNVTNDSGAVQGVTDGNADLATGFQPVQLTNQATGAALTSAPTGSGTYKFGVIGKYLQLTGSSVTASKVLVYLSKIS